MQKNLIVHVESVSVNVVVLNSLLGYLSADKVCTNVGNENKL